jgi:hypothetical protein
MVISDLKAMFIVPATHVYYIQTKECQAGAVSSIFRGKLSLRELDSLSAGHIY